MQNINVVVLTGNLTKDPELKSTGGGVSVCRMRVACDGRRKNASTGSWEDKPNYFDVTCFGSQAENCAKYLAKGRPIAVDGRLDWQEWETDGQKRQAVQIIADTIQFLGGGDGESRSSVQPASDIPIDTSDFGAPVSNPADDDIPF